MKIPSEAIERFQFVKEVMSKCLVSKETRKTDYSTLRSWYLFGSGPNETPAHFNKIYSHLDQLVSFLYAADTTRFTIHLGESVHKDEYKKAPILTAALNDKWSETSGDMVFNLCLTWAGVYGCTFFKVIIAPDGNPVPYMVEPASIGVLREDIPYTDRQEAFVHSYYMTKTDLELRLASHPKKKALLDRATAMPKTPENVPSGVDRIITSQVNPTIYGTVNLELSGYNRMQAQVEADVVEMHEIYIWNDDINDYQVFTLADPDIIVFDRPQQELFLKGESSVVQVPITPQYDYYWGQSEVQKLVILQQMRNQRMSEIIDLLAQQVKPPTALSGFSGIQDEKNFAFNRAGALLTSDMPNAKVERFSPEMPPDLFAVIKEIDEMFAEVSGISSVLSGRGEQGVRSQGHAQQLARLGSSRAKRRALQVEESLEKIATLYMKVMQAYDKTQYETEDGLKFIAEQFTKDYTVKVDAHSNSPIFMEDLRQLAFNLFKAQAIDRESLIDLLDPPMKQTLKERLKKMEQKQAQQQQVEQAGDGE